jgi:hypothetical protein
MNIKHTIGQYVERNDVKGLAEFFRAYLEDEPMKTNKHIAKRRILRQMLEHSELLELTRKLRPPTGGLNIEEIYDSINTHNSKEEDYIKP